MVDWVNSGGSSEEYISRKQFMITNRSVYVLKLKILYIDYKCRRLFQYQFFSLTNLLKF